MGSVCISYLLTSFLSSVTNIMLNCLFINIYFVNIVQLGPFLWLKLELIYISWLADHNDNFIFKPWKLKFFFVGKLPCGALGLSTCMSLSFGLSVLFVWLSSKTREGVVFLIFKTFLLGRMLWVLIIPGVKNYFMRKTRVTHAVSYTLKTYV